MDTPVTKGCFKCGETKPLSDFYKHSQMADGHLNKCKVCNRKDVTENRNSKIDYYRDYDKERGNRQTSADVQTYRESNSAKYKAHTKVNNAVRDGKLEKKPCELCGATTNIHAHHDDYSKPLDVRWLCPPHHFEWHKQHGEAKNSN